LKSHEGTAAMFPVIIRSIIVSEMTKSCTVTAQALQEIQERMTEEMGLQMFPENRY